ncbi:MAG TPA: hypothetical protein VGC70_07225, partial [Burkholderiales bacterium]
SGYALKKQHAVIASNSVTLRRRSGQATQSSYKRNPVRHEIATAASLPPRDDNLRHLALPC